MQEKIRNAEKSLELQETHFFLHQEAKDVLTVLSQKHKNSIF